MAKASTAKRGVGRAKMSDAEKEARKAALANEGKDAKFLRLGLPRINKALSAIKQIGNLSSASYAYTDEQVKKMRDAIEDQVADTFSRFEKGGTKEKRAFSF